MLVELSWVELNVTGHLGNVAYWLYVSFMPKQHILIYDRQNFLGDRPPLDLGPPNRKCACHMSIICPLSLNRWHSCTIAIELRQKIQLNTMPPDGFNSLASRFLLNSISAGALPRPVTSSKSAGCHQASAGGAWGRSTEGARIEAHVTEVWIFCTFGL